MNMTNLLKNTVNNQTKEMKDQAAGQGGEGVT
jgi:hypothetical protein